MAADPGGVFPSDEHRRLLANIADAHSVRGWRDGPQRNTAEGLAYALTVDHTKPASADFRDRRDEVQAWLNDLEGEGFVNHRADDTYSRTKAGTEALCAPSPDVDEDADAQPVRIEVGL